MIVCQNLVGTTVYGGHNLPTPSWNRVKVAAKTWCGHVPTSTCPQARLHQMMFDHQKLYSPLKRLECGKV